MTYLSKDKNKYFEGDGSLNEDGLSLEEFLENYDPAIYRNPSSTVDTAVFTYSQKEEDLKILLIKRKNHPSIGQWAIPGGFVEFEEDIDVTAKRELEEETGLKGLFPVQVKTYGEPGRDPRTRIVTTLYAALVNENDISPKAGDDAGDAALFAINLEEEGDNLYRLRLSCTDRNLFLSAVLKKEVNEKGLVPITKYRMTKSDGIGLDHGALIADAYEFVMRNKDNE